MDERKSHASGVQAGRHTNKRIATGFDLEPLADGNVLIEFYADDGKTFNTQIMTASVVRSMPTVATGRPSTRTARQ